MAGVRRPAATARLTEAAGEAAHAHRVTGVRPAGVVVDSAVAAAAVAAEAAGEEGDDELLSNSSSIFSNHEVFKSDMLTRSGLLCVPGRFVYSFDIRNPPSVPAPGLLSNHTSPSQKVWQPSRGGRGTAARHG